MADETSGFDARLYIKLTHDMPENRKVVGLSDKAFRAYVTALCYCSRQETDGRIVAGAVRLIGSARTLNELVDAGLMELDGKDYLVHDYLKHQRSSAEVAAYRESRADDGKLGAHKRWHVARRKRSDDCEYCLKGVASA